VQSTFKATIQNLTAVLCSGCRRGTGNELHQETQTDRKVWEAEWKMRSQNIKKKWIRRSKVKDVTHRLVWMFSNTY
jgi:hypothetical protein